MERGQISIEYVIIVGFVSLVLIGIIGLAFFYTGAIADRLVLNQVAEFSEKVISSSERVFYAGEPSRATIVASLPEGVQDITVVDYDLVFNITTSNGEVIIAYTSDVLLEGNLSSNSGAKEILLIASDDMVTLVEQ